MDPDFRRQLTSSTARAIFGRDSPEFEDDAITFQSCNCDWPLFVSRRLESLLEKHSNTSDINYEVLAVGTAALNTFVQANVTGPPLDWHPADDIFPKSITESTDVSVEKLQKSLIMGLSSDGEAIYHLVPHIEVFYTAKLVLNHEALHENPELRLARMRVNFWHQRLLSDVSISLQESIFNDLKVIEKDVLANTSVSISPAEFLIERANIHIHYGLDHQAKVDIYQAAKERSFHFALTGRLGKRTKYQDRELSQLVVLAKSAEQQETIQRQVEDTEDELATPHSNRIDLQRTLPQKVNLDDDTLLESIAFATAVQPLYTGKTIHPSLEFLDPGTQPLLEPIDAIILLAIASSIMNISPTDGLTREEILPYAERVITGGSSNWQVYTQALLVRSRIEGYRTRTIERGVLQLQAVVDQVIAETTASVSAKNNANLDPNPPGKPTATFLAQLKALDSAPVSERLRYIHQLAFPPRWKLESELADRWVSLGGLRTALEIYERLQMWAEVALCWAANDREDKARKIIRQQLYSPVTTASSTKHLEDDDDPDTRDYTTERDPLPADAPRLFCILGDIEKSTAAYTRAWEVSKCRYARAQRSLGKFYSTSGDLDKADKAYAMSLQLNPQNHAIWFALGCIRLQKEDWSGAVDAFSRAVQVEDTDAETWSNLAVALLKLPGEEEEDEISHTTLEDVDNSVKTDAPGHQKHIREAFIALKRASSLKRDSFRIWQNLLSVSVKLVPPPYTDIVIAQSRLIELLGRTDGERCIDVEVVEALVAHLISAHPVRQLEQGLINNSEEILKDNPTNQQDKPDSVVPGDMEPEDKLVHGSSPTRRAGSERMIIDLVQKKITPLITSSRRLWLLTAKLALYLEHPFASLAAYEKAWRVTLNEPGWETGTAEAEGMWKEVADSTIDLLDAYESLGERTREGGLGAGELVAKDWKFKARSAARSVLARAKEGWENDDGYRNLRERLPELKSL